MTHTITLEDAEARFQEIMRQAEAGERFLVTEEGQAVARIEPPPNSTLAERLEAIEAIKEIRKGVTLGGLSIKEMVNEGRP